MNTYQESLDELKAFIYEELDDSNLSQNHFNREIRSLQELVDKETPAKLIKDRDRDDLFTCPNCKKWFLKSGLFIVDKGKRCPDCGQVMDWNWYDKS